MLAGEELTSPIWSLMENGIWIKETVLGPYNELFVVSCLYNREAMNDNYITRHICIYCKCLAFGILAEVPRNKKDPIDLVRRQRLAMKAVLKYEKRKNKQIAS